MKSYMEVKMTMQFQLVVYSGEEYIICSWFYQSCCNWHLDAKDMQPE